MIDFTFDTALKTAGFTFLLSIVCLPFVAGMLRSAHRPMRKPKPNGGTKPSREKNLDAPTYTRNQIQRMKESGFTIVNDEPKPFKELTPMPISEDQKERIKDTLKP